MGGERGRYQIDIETATHARTRAHSFIHTQPLTNAISFPAVRITSWTVLASASLKLDFGKLITKTGKTTTSSSTEALGKYKLLTRESEREREGEKGAR